MASRHTAAYQLNQWDPEDRVIRIDFNEDNQKIDAALSGLAGQVAAKAEKAALDALSAQVAGKASQTELNSLSVTVSKKGNCRVETGSYVGSGVSGPESPNSLTFSSRPLFVIISGSHTGVFPGLTEQGRTAQISSGMKEYSAYSWSGSTLTWNCPGGVHAAQLNLAGETYHYVAFFGIL